jgi:feruloyl-CoA synthase
LRAKLTDVLQGLIRDAVIVGEGHDSLGALLVPFRPNIEKIIPDGATMDDATLFSHPLLHEKLADLLGQYNATATGSSLRILRAMVLTTPLDMNKGEVTDKGSVNQRAVRNHRAELVDQLYASGADVIQGKRV